MAEHYDVIIIGTGAGGGTLAHTLAASGKRILLLERGNFLPREMDNWDPEPVFIDGKYISKDTWYDADGKPFQPQVHYYVGGRHQALRRRAVPAASAGLRRAPARRRDLAGVAADLRRLRAVVHEGRVALPGARQRRRGPDRGPPVASRTRGPRCPTSRGSSSSPTSWPRRLPPVPRPVRHPARRGRPGARAPASAAPGATATRAWSTPRPTPRSIAVRPILDRPNVTLLVDAEVTRLETDACGPHRHRRRRLPRRRAPRSTAATSSSCRPGPSNSAKLLLRSANDQHPNGLANGSDQVGRNYMFHNCKAIVALWQGAQRHRRSRRRSGSTTSTSGAATTTGRSATSR